MVLKKCVKCNSNITKKTPGLECSRCEKVVHATNECASLTSKQLTALRSSEGLEWSCEDCIQNASRRSSYFVPEDTEETASTIPFDMQKFMRNISAEIRKTIQEELEGFQESLEFIGNQVANIEEVLKNQNSKIKQLENKNTELVNAKKNMELRLSAMEQRLEEAEQKGLNSFVEIAGLPNIPNVDLKAVTKSIAMKLQIETDTVHDVRQVTGRTKRSGYLLLELNSKSARDKWLTAAKSKDITVGELSVPVPMEKATNKVYVREALSRNKKALLYQAKQRLKTPNGPFKYVWCKEGKIYVKKSDDSKKVQLFVLWARLICCWLLIMRIK